MKIYIWEYLSDVTNEYHSGGAVVVKAENASEAIAMIPAAARESAHADYDAGNVREMELSSVHRAEAPELFIFRDAGCC